MAAVDLSFSSISLPHTTPYSSSSSSSIATVTVTTLSQEPTTSISTVTYTPPPEQTTITSTYTLSTTSISTQTITLTSISTYAPPSAIVSIKSTTLVSTTVSIYTSSTPSVSVTTASKTVGHSTTLDIKSAVDWPIAYCVPPKLPHGRFPSLCTGQSWTTTASATCVIRVGADGSIRNGYEIVKTGYVLGGSTTLHPPCAQSMALTFPVSAKAASVTTTPKVTLTSTIVVAAAFTTGEIGQQVYVQTLYSAKGKMAYYSAVTTMTITRLPLPR